MNAAGVFRDSDVYRRENTHTHLIREVASRIASYGGPASERDFARYKDVVTRELQSFDNLQPYMHAG